MEQMDTSKLSGEPIIVHHVPLVHCQIPGRQCCGPVKHPNPFCPPDNLGLTRTTSLPERDVLHREALVYSSLIQTSSSGSSTGSDGHSTGRTESLASNSCEESALSPVLCKSRYRGGPLRHNPFLLSPDEDEEKDEGCGDKGGIPKGYLEDYSFYLHGNSKGTANKVTGVSSFHLHDVEYSRESIQSAAHVEDGELPKRHGSTSSPLSMDCGEQDWAEDEDETDEDHHMINGHSSQACSYCSSPNVDLPHSHHCRCCSLSEPPLESKQEYGSDDSYKGWDGPVVNFTAIYHEMSNVIPAKPLNLNVATTPSLTSTTSDSGGTFYLDLHTSPEPRHDVDSCSSDAGKNALYCYNAQQAVDANCNTYPISISSSQTADLSSCVQSQARLGLATQNYYKLVPCDLSSQSSPSPAGSSATSCSEERGSPNQPTEYFLFRQPTGEMEAEVEEEDKEEDVLTQREEEEGEDRIREEGGFETPVTMLEGQVYVNLSPPLGSCSQSGGQAAGHPRSRSYDRSLDASQSLERMLSCPLRLSEASPRCSPRVTSFAEIARSKKRGAVSCREISSSRSQSSLEVAPVLELKHSAEPHCDSQSNQSSQSSCALQSQHHLHPLLGGLPGADYCETDAKAEVGLSSSASPDSLSSVVRYSKEKRPNSLPIQPFMFQPQLGKAQNQVLRPLLSEYISQMQSRARGKLAEDPPKRQSTAPGSVRPSPLGSYSPAHQREVSSFEACSTCCLSSEDGQGSSKAPHSLSCPGTIKPLPLLATPWSFSLPTEAQEHGLVQGRPPASTTPFSLKKDLSAPSLPVASVRCIQRSSTPTSRDPWEHSYGSCEQMKASVADCSGTRLSKMHHLSPQALKWREYRRQNPLGVEKDSHLPPGCLSAKKGEGFLAWRNVFHFPASFSHAQSQLHGQPLKQVQHQHGESLPNYISLTERPPEEFSLSPDVTSEPTSVDVLQKKSLVKAMNMAVDLIVAHFGTSRDPGVKAKLGNSSVSPNVGHLILKYLCPAIRDVLQDGLRAYVLDLIIGQRRNLPWSVVEASAQLGPSTRVIHGLFSKVSHYSELTSHSLRLNAFIFGLLNLRLLEFWFSHLFTHEDIVAMHYHPWGFLPLSQGVCQPLFQELLLLLQPLSLLPFDLDLLFEPQLLQRSQEHIRHKEQLCSAGLGLEQSARSTFQLMRGWDKAGVHTKREAAEARVGEVVVEGEAMESSWEGPLLNIGGMYPSKYGMDQQRGNISESEKGKVEPGAKKPVRGWTQTEATFLNKHSGDLVASRGKAWQEVKGLEVQEKSEVGEKGEKDKKMNVDRQRDRQAGWWYQLMQSSQVYIENSTEGSRFVKWEKRKKPAGGGEAEMGCGQNQYPPREGVVEGAEADKVDELQKELWSGNSCRMNDSSGKGKERLSWMGSPPESRLNEPRKTEDREPQRLAATVETREGGTSSTMWWGRLFGSGMSNPVRADKEDQGPVKSQKNRMPSGWLSLDKSMLDIVAQAVGVGKRVDPRLPSSNLAVTTEQQTEIQPTEPSSWEVRALCHHLATEPGHLSFNKGDRLKVLNHIDPDWLHCALGDDVGLVPMIYVTLTEGSPGSQ